MMDHNVGIIGVDGPGGTIAGHLLDQGFRVSIFDERQVPARLRRHRRASVEQLPADVAEAAAVVLLTVDSDVAAEEALFDLGGVGETLCDGGVVLDLSPSTAETGRDRTLRLARLGLIRLEARLVDGTGCSIHLSADAAAGDLTPAAAVLDALETTLRALQPVALAA